MIYLLAVIVIAVVVGYITTWLVRDRDEGIGKGLGNKYFREMGMESDEKEK